MSADIARRSSSAKIATTTVSRLPWACRPRRRAERCAWMAATLKEAAPEGDNTWSEFALVARDLSGKKPLETIPLARRIAGATVEAFEQR
jgi:hypothetical protein